MSDGQLVQYLFSGITVGSIYAVVAIGFNIIYNTTGIINFAQGEFLVLGAMTAITLTPLLPLPLALLAAVVLTLAVGGLIELLFIRWLREPAVLRVIIITIGVSILLREGMLHVWDDQVRALPHFTGSEISSLSILGARLSPQVLWVLATAAAVVLFLFLFFRFTLTGRAMRACAANRTAARLCGIDARWMVTLSFCLSAALGALAGCAISPLAQTQYDMGASLAIKGFSAAVIGGLGSSGGAVAAGLLIGLLETASIGLLPMAYKDVVAIALLLVILTVRPGGLFVSRAAGALREH